VLMFAVLLILQLKYQCLAHMTPITSCFQSDPLEQKNKNKCNVNVGENNTITCTHTYMKIRFQ